MSLQKLPNHIIQSIVSGSAPIYSYKSAVEELVFNSIDAGASSIAIRVDIDQNSIQVIDNGNGIPRQDFMLLGERYATRKFEDISALKSASNQYGYRGQSLASIIEVSKSLKITSRHDTDSKTWVKSFIKGLNPNISELVQRPSKGTTVDVKGFLFNHSIQKKTVNPTIEIHEIKRFLSKLALVHNNISLSLRDDTQNEIIFKLHKNRDLYQTLNSLFGIEKAEVQEYKVEKNQYKVTAFIGKTNCETSYHWIYLNGRYISESKLHHLINTAMKKSLNLNVTKKKVIIVNNFNQDNEQIQKKLPYYFIFIQCPYYDYDVVINSKKTVVEFKNWNQINRLLDKLIKFYSGNMKLKEIKVDNAKPVKQQPLQNKEEVEKIIKKILGINKKPNVSQLQNGVKGKLVKRKLKTAASKISLSKVIPKEKIKAKESNSEKGSTKVPNNACNSNDVIEEHIPKPKTKITKLNAKVILNSPNTNQNVSKYSNKDIKRKPKIQKIALTKKVSKVKRNKTLQDRVIKKFNEQTDSVSRKCNMLSKQVEELMNCKDEPKKVAFSEEVDDQCDVDTHNKSRFVAINHKERKANFSIPKEPDTYICTFDNRDWKNKKWFTKSTYDLLQTIIKSQQHAADNKFETLYSVQQSSKRNFDGDYVIESQQSYKYTYSKVDTEKSALKTTVEGREYPSHTDDIRMKTLKDFDFYKLTYESHNYNKKSMTTDSHLTYFSKISYSPNNNNFHFITKKSKENFTLPKEQGYLRNKNKCNIKNKRRNIPYSKLNDIRHIKETFSNSTHRSITIDFTESNNIESNHPNIENGSHKETTYYTIDNITDNTEGFRINSQINSTYTIISNSANVIYDSFDKATNNSEVIGENEPEITPGSNHDSQLIEIQSDNDETVREQAYVFQSTQQNSKDFIAEENIEPLEYCQTIMDTDEPNRNTEHRNRRNDSLFADDFSIESVLCDRNIYTPNQQNTIPDNLANTTNFSDENHKDKKTNDDDVGGVKELNYRQDNKYFDRNDLNLIEAPNNFELNNRLPFVPKGMSQIFRNCRTKTVCEYNSDEEYFKEDIYKNFINDVQANAEVFQSEIQNVLERATKNIDKANQRLNKDNSSLKFDAESLKSVKVLGQVDHKFIAATIESKSTNKQEKFLVLFDQHAVHERIRLENNLSDYLQQDQWKSLSLELMLQLNREEVLYLHNYKDKFNQLGLQWTVSNCEVSISAIPEAILGKNSRPVDVIIKTVKKLISEEVNTIRTQKGCITLYPKAIMDLVFSEACRYAIKFGDTLSKNECIELLKSLSQCKTPFQCAHGRPVMAVIMNWRSEQRSYKTSDSKITKYMKRNCK